MIYPHTAPILSVDLLLLGGTLATLGISFAAWRLRRRLPFLLAGWLWFLHADSAIEPNACERAAKFVRGNPECIGYGWLRFQSDGPALTRLNALGANLRSRVFGLPYGDQGLCIRAAACRSQGGFREDRERGEDLDFSVRARAAGLSASPMGLRVTTSGRRYAESGWLRTSWQHQIAACRLIRNARAAVRAESS